MAPRKAVDKGKAVMIDVDEVNRPVTRSRSAGIVIRSVFEPEWRPRERPRMVEIEMESQKVAQRTETVKTSAPTPDEVVEEVSLRAQANVSGLSVEALVAQAMQGVEERMIARMETMMGTMEESLQKSFQDYMKAQEQQGVSSVRRKRPLSSEKEGTPGLEPVRARQRKKSKVDRGACFRCGQSGHQKRNCPQSSRSTQEQTCGPPQGRWQRQKSAGQVTCYQCGQPGHRRWECPQLKGPLTTPGQRRRLETPSAGSAGTSGVEATSSSHTQTIVGQEAQTAKGGMAGNLVTCRSVICG